MDSTNATDAARQILENAAQQSPTTGNGFGFGLQVMVGVCIICLSVAFVVWKALRSDARRNWQAENDARIEARKQFNDNIASRFDRLESQTKEAFNELASESKADGERFAKLGERVARLETIHEIKPPREGG